MHLYILKICLRSSHLRYCRNLRSMRGATGETKHQCQYSWNFAIQGSCGGGQSATAETSRFSSCTPGQVEPFRGRAKLIISVCLLWHVTWFAPMTHSLDLISSQEHMNLSKILEKKQIWCFFRSEFFSNVHRDMKKEVLNFIWHSRHGIYRRHRVGSLQTPPPIPSVAGGFFAETLNQTGLLFYPAAPCKPWQHWDLNAIVFDHLLQGMCHHRFTPETYICSTGSVFNVSLGFKHHTYHFPCFFGSKCVCPHQPASSGQHFASVLLNESFIKFFWQNPNPRVVLGSKLWQHHCAVKLFEPRRCWQPENCHRTSKKSWSVGNYLLKSGWFELFAEGNKPNVLVVTVWHLAHTHMANTNILYLYSLYIYM